MRFLPLVLVGLLSGGCALFNAWWGIDFEVPGRGVTSGVAQQWGCDVDRVKANASEYRKQAGVGGVFIPQVGWDACELLARTGAPRDHTIHQSAHGQAASWWYGNSMEAHLVTLILDERRGRWVVDSVNWSG
jgi:hypothetical protein